MQISNTTIFNKMQHELDELKKSQIQADIASHMSNIKLLSELWLDEYQAQDKHSIKHHESIKQAEPLQTNREVPEADDDGMSIFEF